MGDKTSDWAKLAEKELRGRPLSDLTWNTLEGIDVQPLYTAEDIVGLDHLNGTFHNVLSGYFFWRTWSHNEHRKTVSLNELMLYGLS